MIRIGTRGSQLALWQANAIASELGRLGHQTAIEVIRTTGDRMQRSAYPASGAKGIFVREIEQALSAGGIDIAVHSLKDLPAELADEFVFAAIPRRADARDVLVSLRYESLSALKANAVVGTGSPRRQAQLEHLRPDLKFVDIRGNVDTRIEKMQRGAVDALVLAAAGLDRLGKTEWVRQRFAVEEICPAPGQGALAVESRANDEVMRSIVAPLDDWRSRMAVYAERAFLAALGGGCQTPIGAYAAFEQGPGRADTGTLRLKAAVASPSGDRLLRDEMRRASLSGSAWAERDAEALGRELAQCFLDRGAKSLLGETSGLA